MNTDLIDELRTIANDLDEIGRPRFASIVDEVALTVLAQEDPFAGTETVEPTASTGLTEPVDKAQMELNDAQAAFEAAQKRLQAIRRSTLQNADKARSEIEQADQPGNDMGLGTHMNTGMGNTTPNPTLYQNRT